MAQFTQTFNVPVSLEAVWQLHEDPKALPALTPPPVQVVLISVERPLKPGAKMAFRMGFGPFSVIWNVVYDEYEPYQPGVKQCHFVDREASGPFHFWTHRHTFTDLGNGTSQIKDEARFELIGGPFGSIVTWCIGWPAIAFLFLYRRLKTRSLLKQT